MTVRGWVFAVQLPLLFAQLVFYSEIVGLHVLKGTIGSGEMVEVVSYENHGKQEPDVKEKTNENFQYQNSATRNRRNLWTNKIVPYEVDHSITASVNRSIHEAIAEYHAKTCITFVKHTNERNWVRFTSSKTCYTGIGKRFFAGRQNIYLSNICKNKRGVMHELMHTLGFYHEMSRPDRDLYIEIMWGSIAKDSLRNFRKQSYSSVDTLGIQYDYDSLLHYHNWAFSKNGGVTIRSRQNPTRDIGRATTFSKLDLIRINALYDCKGSFGNWSSWSGFSPCDKKCKKYRQRFCYSNNRRKDCPLADKNGIDTEVVKCSRKQCYAAVNGQWSKWSAWSACSSSCGYGNQTRTRRCNDPVPKHGGKACVGKGLETNRCLEESRGPVYYRFMVLSIKHKRCLSHWGNKITLKACNKNLPGQKWAWSAYDQLVSVATGLCVDLNDKVKDGTLILSRCCNKETSQLWVCNGTRIGKIKKNLYIDYSRKRKTIVLRSARKTSEWKVFGENIGNVCSKKPDCAVKSERQGCCEFPFHYKGKRYTSCAFSSTSDRTWCATSPDYPRVRKWGYCPSVPKSKAACKVKTTKGECCFFPFKYGKKMFHSCTTVNFGNRLWCSTTFDYDKDRKWGRC